MPFCSSCALRYLCMRPAAMAAVSERGVEEMECPNCGCENEAIDLDERSVLQCPSCETVWLIEDEGLDLTLLGSEA